jgi:hypothetical protein
MTNPEVCFKPLSCVAEGLDIIILLIITSMAKTSLASLAPEFSWCKPSRKKLG